jgi:hypothetical protein
MSITTGLVATQLLKMGTNQHKHKADLQIGSSAQHLESWLGIRKSWIMAYGTGLQVISAFIL